MDYLNPIYKAPKKGNIKITLASLVDNFQEFLTKRNYFLYNISTKTQIFDIKQTKIYYDLHEKLRASTYSHFYDDYAFYKYINNTNKTVYVDLGYSAVRSDDETTSQSVYYAYYNNAYERLYSSSSSSASREVVLAPQEAVYLLINNVHASYSDAVIQFNPVVLIDDIVDAKLDNNYVKNVTESTIYGYKFTFDKDVKYFDPTQDLYYNSDYGYVAVSYVGENNNHINIYFFFLF